MTALKPNLYRESEEGWIRHNGGRCPVDPETIVRPWIKGVGEAKQNYAAKQLNWGDYTDPADGKRLPGAILGYRVIEETVK